MLSAYTLASEICVLTLYLFHVCTDLSVRLYFLSQAREKTLIVLNIRSWFTCELFRVDWEAVNPAMYLSVGSIAFVDVFLSVVH